MDLPAFKTATKQTTTVLVEYAPDAHDLEPKITIHKIGVSETTITIGQILHKIAELTHDTTHQYVVGVSLNQDQQMALLNASEADQLTWLNEQLAQNDLVYAW